MRFVLDYRMARDRPAAPGTGTQGGERRSVPRPPPELAGRLPVLRAVPVTADAPLMQPSRPADGTDGTPVLDREFRAATLAALREAVLGCAAAAGLSRDRSIEVMIAAHELAANVVRHGSGRGRLRMRVTARALSCQVSDTGAAESAEHHERRQPGAPAVPAPAAAWPVEHGHGLWLVRKTADQVQVTAGPAGSVVSMIFNLPAPALPAG